MPLWDFRDGTKFYKSSHSSLSRLTEPYPDSYHITSFHGIGDFEISIQVEGVNGVLNKCSCV